MEYEPIPAAIAMACFLTVLGGLWLYRRRKLRRMTPRQRAYFLEAERRPLDGR